MSSVSSGSTSKHNMDDSSSFRLSPLRSAHSNVTSTLPSPIHTHMDTTSDSGSHPSFITSFFKNTMHCVRQPLPSPSCETDTDLDMMRSDRQRGDTDVKHKGAELACPVVLDLKQ